MRILSMFILLVFSIQICFAQNISTNPEPKNAKNYLRINELVTVTEDIEVTKYSSKYQAYLPQNHLFQKNVGRYCRLSVAHYWPYSNLFEVLPKESFVIHKGAEYAVTEKVTSDENDRLRDLFSDSVGGKNNLHFRLQAMEQTPYSDYDIIIDCYGVAGFSFLSLGKRNIKTETVKLIVTRQD